MMVKRLGYINFHEEHDLARDIIDRPTGSNATVNVVGERPRSGKSEFLLEVKRRRTSSLRTVLVDVGGPDSTNLQIVRDVQRQLGLSIVIPQVPPVTAQFHSHNSSFTGTNVNVGLSSEIIAAAECVQGVEAIRRELQQPDSHLLLLVDGIDACSTGVRAFVIDELIAAVASCERVTVFVATGQPVRFRGLAALNCHEITLPRVTFKLFMEVCDDLQIDLSPESRKAVYQSTDGTIGGIVTALEQWLRNQGSS